ncbi:MAG: metal ABC transporter substrate-binding protein, partial [Mobilitalea sp.]
MKKIMITLLSMCLLAFLLNGCSSVKNVSTSSDKVSVVSTIFAPYDFAREITGDKVDLTMLLPPASESHSYEPTPQDIIKIQNCDVFIYVGGESDAWVNEVLESMDTSKMKIITLMDCVTVVEEEVVEGMEEEHEHEDLENEEHADEENETEESADLEHEYDEHVWTSPKNAKL